MREMYWQVLSLLFIEQVTLGFKKPTCEKFIFNRYKGVIQELISRFPAQSPTKISHTKHTLHLLLSS